MLLWFFSFKTVSIKSAIVQLFSVLSGMRSVIQEGFAVLKYHGSWPALGTKAFSHKCKENNASEPFASFQ